MEQKTLNLLQFHKKFGTEKACQKQSFMHRIRFSGHKILLSRPRD